VATIEGTGIKTPSEGSQRIAKVYYGGPEAEKRRQLKKDLDKFMKDFGGSPASDPFNPKGRGMGDRYDPTASNYFSPSGGAYDSRNNVETAFTGSDFSGLVSKSDTDTKVASNAYSDASGDFNKYLNENYGFDSDSKTYRNIPGNMKRILKDSFNDDAIKFREGTQINQAPTKEKTIGERVADFTGNVVNTVTGTQSAVAQTKETGKGMFGGSVPEGTYSQFSPTSKPQYQVNREKNRPSQNTNTAEAGAGVKFGSVNLNVARGIETPSEDTSFSSYVRGARPGQERGNTGLAQARKVANRNPNVSINKSTGRAEATNDSGKAKAQASALNRRISGGGGPKQSGSDKAKAMAKRNIKKHGGTASAAAANKASMRKRAKARHKASQARRKARRSKKSKKCDIFLKYNISPLTNMNLIRDDLAEVAYFVKEIQK